MDVYIVFEIVNDLTGVSGVYTTLERAIEEAKKLGDIDSRLSKVRIKKHGKALIHGVEGCFIINMKLDESIKL